MEGHFAQPPARQGRDLEQEIQLSPKDVLHGTTVTLSIKHDGPARTVSVRFPPGAKTGARLRIPGQGEQVSAGAKSGDLYLRIRVAPAEDPSTKTIGSLRIGSLKTDAPVGSLNTESPAPAPGLSREPAYLDFREEWPAPSSTSAREIGYEAAVDLKRGEETGARRDFAKHETLVARRIVNVTAGVELPDKRSRGIAPKAALAVFVTLLLMQLVSGIGLASGIGWHLQLLIIGIVLLIYGLVSRFGGPAVGAPRRGFARNVELRYDQRKMRDVLTFHLDRYDVSGNQLAPVGVELRNPRQGHLAEGDEVAVTGLTKHGTLAADRIVNVTTGSEIVGDFAKKRSNAKTFAIALLVTLVVVAIVFLFAISPLNTR